MWSAQVIDKLQMLKAKPKGGIAQQNRRTINDKLLLSNPFVMYWIRCWARSTCWRWKGFEYVGFTGYSCSFARSNLQVRSQPCPVKSLIVEIHGNSEQCAKLKHFNVLLALRWTRLRCDSCSDLNYLTLLICWENETDSWSVSSVNVFCLATLISRMQDPLQ